MTRRIPWVTISVCLLALLVAVLPTQEWFLYKRTNLMQGQLWRLYSGHWAHFGGAHLFWNVLTLLVAGTWLEVSQRRLLLWCFGLVPPLVSLGLLLLCPRMEIYGGLSAVVVAVTTSLCVVQQRTGMKLLWRGLLLCLIAKIIFEGLSGNSLTGLFRDSPVRAMPQAHALGLVLGLLLAWSFSRPKQLDTPRDTAE